MVNQAEDIVIDCIAKGDKSIVKMLKMLHSCLVYSSCNYDFYDRNTDSFVGYGIEYSEGIENAKEITKKYIDLFNKHCHVKSGVYTDAEGCSYNSAEWDEYIEELDLHINCN